jgi:hypothetical protein
MKWFLCCVCVFCVCVVVMLSIMYIYDDGKNITEFHYIIGIYTFIHNNILLIIHS